MLFSKNFLVTLCLVCFLFSCSIIENEKILQKTAVANAEDQITQGKSYSEDDGKFPPKDATKSFDWCQKAAKQGNANAQFNLGLMYYNGDGVQKDPIKAIEWFEKAADQGNTDAQKQLGAIWNILGDASVKSNQYAKATEAYQQAIRLNPEDASSWINLGVTYLYTKQFPKAIDAFQQALRINPEDAEAWYILGAAYKENGQTSQAIDVYKRLKTLDPVCADRFFNEIVMP